MFGIFGILLIPICCAVEKAEMKKVSEEICKEKGYGKYALPNSNRVLQERYFNYYVRLRQSMEPKPNGFGRITTDLLVKVDEDGRAIKDKDGKYVYLTAKDRYYMAVNDFQKLGYSWDSRYDPYKVK